MRLLIAARPFDLSDARFDGFVTRHRAMIDALRTRHELRVLTIGRPDDGGAVGRQLQDLVIGHVRLPSGPTSRRERLAGAARLVVRRRLEEWDERMLALARRTGPDAVVTVGPWLDHEYAPLFGAYPSVHLFEEDLSRMHELAPQSRRAQLFRRAETLTRTRVLTDPRTVVTISEAELPAARRRHPKSDAVCIPYTLSPADWPLADSVSYGDALLVVGALVDERHAEGLREVLGALAARRPADLRVRLISGAGLHPTLEPYLDLPWVEIVGDVADPRPLYRGARLALVPARRATGMKTTILQAWASGCPVVTFSGSAATVGVRFSDALLADDDAAGVAAHVAAAWSEAELRAALAARGLAAIRTHFDAAHHRARLLALVEAAARA